uniref:Uncharacterized protein n=1 Tax=Anopheles darlingi TaxID=43151 RepID=A0A2M4DH56_ANODA
MLACLFWWLAGWLVWWWCCWRLVLLGGCCFCRGNRSGISWSCHILILLVVRACLSVFWCVRTDDCCTNVPRWRY